MSPFSQPAGERRLRFALHDGTKPVVGVVHQPFVGETFLGATGRAWQWRRGDQQRTLRTRPCARIEDAIVVTTDPRQFRTPEDEAALRAAFPFVPEVKR